MSLVELQQQIVSKAVKAFREEFLLKRCAMVNTSDGYFGRITAVDNGKLKVILQNKGVENRVRWYEPKDLFTRGKSSELTHIAVESFLTDQLIQAMRKVAEENTKHVLGMDIHLAPLEVMRYHDMLRKRADSWLNQDSEGV